MKAQPPATETARKLQDLLQKRGKVIRKLEQVERAYRAKDTQALRDAAKELEEALK